MNPVLQVEELSKSFPGVQALQRVSLDLHEGEVHVLVGENGAGKSTLIKLICGMYPLEGGKMTYKGAPYAPLTPHDAIKSGIRVVYQEFNLLPYLSVAENIFFDSLPRKHGLVDFKKLHSDAERVLDRVGLNVSPTMPVELLGVAQMQLLEIAKAVSAECSVLILDEPTATLSPKDTDNLFGIIHDLKKQGLAIIYISHHLKEIYEIGDTVTVLRNGERVETCSIHDVRIPDLVAMMVGRKMESEYPFRDDIKQTGKVILSVRNLCFKGNTNPVSFELREGELLGISGLVGSKRTETLRAIFGADPKEGGEILLNGSPLEIGSPKEAVEAGLSLLTEDRKNQGLVLDMSLSANITLADLSRVSNAGLLRVSAEREASKKLSSELGIKTPSIRQLARNLSGGNQQKLVLAKWLFRDAKVLMFDEPTRGIDVGAKYEIYLLLWELLAEDKGILLVSSDLNELMGICHRIIVFSNGRITGDLKREEFSQERILECAYKEYIG
ncbi:MAG: sugar ABC transporter ATP-binding protein [Fretibacterium sp.]|nr:sugar ABC transporter ATP-binding protein [Fretibacterium sp.]